MLPGTRAMDTIPDEQHSHPPYAWLGAAVLFWGMCVFLLAPMLWRWLGVGAQQPVSQAERTLTVDQTLPATCNVGDIFIDRTAPAGQHIYHCVTADTWAFAPALGSMPATARDADWRLWRMTLSHDRSAWTFVYPYASETACEDAKEHFTVREQAHGIMRVGRSLVCLPWHIDPYLWTEAPSMKEPQP
jgi:hypothetical protein